MKKRIGKWVAMLMMLVWAATSAFALAEAPINATVQPAAQTQALAEGEIEPEESWIDATLGGLLGMKWTTAVVLAALVGLGVVMRANRHRWSARELSYAAMCIAIAFVLSCIKLFQMPQGGAVTPASMLPLILFMVSFGPARGAVVGCAYGLLQMVESAYVIHPVQLLLDYPLAFAAMAAACLALLLPKKAERFRLPLAVVLAYAARLLVSTLSGAIFFAEYAGGQNVWVYSLAYNASYLGVEAAIACALTLFIPGMNRLTKAMHA